MHGEQQTVLTYMLDNEVIIDPNHIRESLTNYLSAERNFSQSGIQDCSSFLTLEVIHCLSCKNTETKIKREWELKINCADLFYSNQSER